MEFLLKHLLELIVLGIQVDHVLVLVFEFSLVALLDFYIVFHLLLKPHLHLSH